MLRRWKSAVDNRKSFGALSTDLSEAFDCLLYALLLVKLHAYRFRLSALKLIHINSDLRKAFANVVKNLCTDLTETQTIEAFLSCRLIPLDKNTGLRPIGVGRVLRRIAREVIVSVLKNDVIDCAGSLQVCAGQEAGIEAVVHSLNSLYNDENTDAVFLVDAGNAFNSLEREVFLQNISYICLAISVFVKNLLLLSPSRLFIIGVKELKPNKGTTQGDPVSMAIYDIGVTPLTNMVIDIAITSTESHNHFHIL